ncbi:HET-domain-containing protein, partial [Stipitochalara longipes BDJ]
HEYVPLDLVAEEIRLVVLLPAKNRTDPLYAHFAHESIYGNVSYQCLSYTWGKDEMTSELILNGMTFPIRKNLEDALRGIRNEISTTTIWIDAVCIDQQNVKERSRQVSRMYQIYENADCVLVWLGETDEDSDLALDFLASANGYNANDFRGLNLTHAKTAAGRARLWAAVYRLLQRPYFRRMWVVQEIAAASLPTV